MGACGLLSQILMFPLDNIASTDNNQVVVENQDKDKDKNNNKDEDTKQANISNEIYVTEKEERQGNNYNSKPPEDTEEEKKTIVVNEPFMQAFKSWRFHLFNFMSVGTLCKLK